MGWYDDSGRYHTDDEPKPPDPSMGMGLPQTIVPASQLIPGSDAAALSANAQQQANQELGVPPPAAQPAMNPPVIPPQPGYVTPGKLETQAKSTTEQYGKLSNESKELLDDRQRLTQDAIETERRAGELRGRQAQQNLISATQLYEIEGNFAKQQQQIIENSQKKIEARRAELDKAVEERKAAKFTDFFDTSGDRGRKFQMTAAIVLGGLGAAFSARGGGSSENKALQTLFQLAERDTQAQQQKIANMDARVAMARAGVRDEEEAKSTLLADAFANKAAAMGKASRLLERNLAQLGRSAEEIASDSRIQAIKSQENQYLQQAYAITNKQISSTTQKQIREANNAAGAQYIKAAQDLINGDVDYKQFGESMKKARGYQELEASLQQAMTSKNPTAINAVIRLVAQQINGGVLSDNEGKQLIEQAGGAWDSANNKISKLATGAPSAETIRKFQGTIGNLRQQAAQTAESSRNGIVQRYGQAVNPAVINMLLPPVGVQERTGLTEQQIQQARQFVASGDPRAQAVRDKFAQMGVQL